MDRFVTAQGRHDRSPLPYAQTFRVLSGSDKAVRKAAMPEVMPHDIIDLDYDVIDGEVEFNVVGLNEVELNDVVGMFDSVCAFCDNGGEILCCEGRCMRSFHATVEAGANMCPSLGFSLGELHGLPRFVCKNCEYQQHQCFACGKLGSSDVFSGAEVFPCVSATCNYFYHPHCVAKLLYQENKAAAEELERNIVAGEYFTCPIHKCCVCKQGENKEDSQLQFAVCRRCPKSYHRKCLPREIAFEDIEEEGIITNKGLGRSITQPCTNILLKS